LGYLLKTKEYKQAAQMVGHVSGDSKEMWEEWIYAFIDQKQFKVIIPYIPINNPRLSDTIYEMKLNYFLMNSPEQFLQAIKEWPHDIYKAQNVIMAVTEQLKNDPSVPLLNALAEL
jgi:PhoPQ-activated pathogenicity-related protein